MLQIKCVKPNAEKKTKFDSSFTLYQLSYLGLLEVIRIRKSGYPVRMSDQDFMRRYKLLVEGGDVIASRRICQDHGTQGDWQIGTTMVFMRDAMYKSMENLRALVMDRHVRSLQQWLREELTRLQWEKVRLGWTRMQAVHRGVVGRRVASRRRVEVGLEKLCADAVQLRKEDLCSSALARADEIAYHPKILDQVRYIIDRIVDERAVEDLLRTAIHQKQLDEVEEALKAVDAIELAKAWSSLPTTDERSSLISRCRLVHDQLTKYGDLMVLLGDAMRARDIEKLHGAIQESERLQMGTPDNPCPEVEEAKAMIKMAEFERTGKKEREARKRKVAQEAHISEGIPSSPECEALRTNLEIAAVSPVLRAAMTACSVEKLQIAIDQATVRLGANLAEQSSDLALAKVMLSDIRAAPSDAASAQSRLSSAMKPVRCDSIRVASR